MESKKKTNGNIWLHLPFAGKGLYFALWEVAYPFSLLIISQII